MKTPEDYLSYMASDAPKEGNLAIDPGWFQLWDLSQVDQLNRDYETQEYAPGFWGFGSDGGGEMLAFGPDGAIFMIPFIPMDRQEAVKIADSWRDFQKAIGK